MILLDEPTKNRIAYIDILIDEILQGQKTKADLECYSGPRDALKLLIAVREYYHKNGTLRPSGPTTLQLPDDNTEN